MDHRLQQYRTRSRPDRWPGESNESPHLPQQAPHRSSSGPYSPIQAPKQPVSDCQVYAVASFCPFQFIALVSFHTAHTSEKGALCAEILLSHSSLLKVYSLERAPSQGAIFLLPGQEELD